HDGMRPGSPKLEPQRAGRRRDVCGSTVLVSHLYRRAFDRLTLAIAYPDTQIERFAELDRVRMSRDLDARCWIRDDDRPLERPRRRLLEWHGVGGGFRQPNADCRLPACARDQIER